MAKWYEWVVPILLSGAIGLAIASLMGIVLLAI